MITGVFIVNSSVNQKKNDGSLEFRDETNLRTANGDINISSPEEKTYMKPMSGYYPATFGFENDRNDETPTEWNDLSSGGLYVKVISNKFGRNKVLEGYDVGSGAFRIEHYFDNTEGTIEFWVAHTTTQTGDPITTKILNSSADGVLFGVGLTDGDVYLTSSLGDTIVGTYGVDTWHHFRFDFRSNSGNPYEGLNQNEFKFYINGTYEGTYNMQDYEDPGRLQLRSMLTSGEFYGYWDAFGFSWDPNYDIGDNIDEGLLLSFDNKTNLDWMGYSLDGQTNATILGNTTIKMPEVGSHTVQVFGNDSGGMMYASELRIFTIPYYNLTGSPIVIDDTVSNKSWKYTAFHYWCTGSGTWSDPYVLKDILIDGQNSGSCILIRNSSVYFRIENCTAYKSSYGMTLNEDAGIKLINVSNGLLINNNCSDNNGYGIFLRVDCDNNTISGNIANNFGTNDQIRGIVLSVDCDDNSILDNTINNNENMGISLQFNCINNNISGNTAYNNYGNAIGLLNNCHDNTISDNTANGTLFGINLQTNCSNNKILNNTANNNTVGIYLWDCNNNNISSNTAYNNTHGIALETSFLNNFSANKIYINANGTLLINSSFNLFEYETVYNNTDAGYYFWGSWSNTIRKSTIVNNSIGVYLKNKLGVSDSRNNNIYWNIFLNTQAVPGGINGHDYGANNIYSWYWEEMIPFGEAGNYWDDYAGAKHPILKGRGDTSYVISPNGRDYYPLLLNFDLYFDTDGDNMPNGWEADNGLNPSVDDATGDFDGDGVFNIDEFLLGTSANNPDSDGDGYSDGDEISLGVDPLERWVYPKPDLDICNCTLTNSSLTIQIQNVGIWNATSIIVLVIIESINLTLYNNSGEPFNLSVDQIHTILVNFSDFDQWLESGQSYNVSILIDPSDAVNETDEINNFIQAGGFTYASAGGIDYFLIFVIIMIIIAISAAVVPIGLFAIKKFRTKGKIQFTTPEADIALDLEAVEEPTEGPKETPILPDLERIPPKALREDAEAPIPAKIAMSEEEIIDLETTESEIDIEEQKILCIIHKGAIDGTVYICPKCKSFYCEKCAKSMKLIGEKCWSCGHEIGIDLPKVD